MRDGTWFNLVAALLAVAIVAFGALAIVYPSSAGVAPATRPAAAPTVYRNLSITFDPSVGTFGYSTTQLAVPTGVAVVFTITNYDPSTAILPAPTDAQVLGTVNDVMTVGSGGTAVTVSAVAPSQVSHTFTLSNGAYHLNVPIPSAASTGHPTVVTFEAVFATPGTFNWGCAVLCGPGGMMARDAMYGTLVVS